MPKMLYLCTLFLNEVRLLLRNFLLKKALMPRSRDGISGFGGDCKTLKTNQKCI